MHAIIIGAGLAGPALAIALRQYDISTSIFEIRNERGDSGGSITLAPNAIRALHACGVSESTLRNAGYSYSKMNVFDHLGYHYGEMQIQNGDIQGLRILRTKLHKVLLETCEANGITVEYGTKVVNIIEAEQDIKVQLASGKSVSGALHHHLAREAGPRFNGVNTGDFLIGADGIHSQVRTYVLGNDRAPKPAFSGTCTVNGFLPRQKVQTPPGFAFPAVIFSPSGIVMSVPNNRDGTTLAWGLSTSCEEKSREEFEEYRSSGQAARDAKSAFEDLYNEPLRSLLDNVVDTECRLWAPYSIPDLPTWHRGRLCLIGDAAHALPPNGQGTAQAFEDAALLARMLSTTRGLSGTDGYDVLFSRFRNKRWPRIEQVKKISKVGSQAKGKTGSTWQWWLKSWAIWAYFMWNRGVVSDSITTSYDVANVAAD